VIPLSQFFFERLFSSQFLSDIPKLLFVGVIERTCRATIIREIPGITECFQTKDDSKKNGEPEIKVHLVHNSHA